MKKMSVCKNYCATIFMGFIILSCSTNNTIDISDPELTAIGNTLAEWSGANCKIITINSMDILFQGPNSGGCSPVGFEFGSVSSGPGEEQIKIIQGNLRNLINTSSCNLTDLKNRVQEITLETNGDVIAQSLACLGTIEILKGESGLE